MTKAATSSGRMPAKVFLAARASVTAGFAHAVEAVNQYAEVIEAAMAYGTAVIFCRTPHMVKIFELRFPVGMEKLWEAFHNRSKATGERCGCSHR